MKTLGEWVRAKPLTRKQAIGWMVRLSRGLLVLHELDVAYGRVSRSCVQAASPEPASAALLLDADEVRQDFHFYSLERIERTGASKDDDVWALGVLLYHLVTGGYPFPGETRAKVGERIKWMPASPITAYEFEDEGIQLLLDRLFKDDEGLRLASLPLLIDALLRLDREADALPPLELGVVVGEDVAPPPPAATPSFEEPSPPDSAPAEQEDDLEDAPTVTHDEPDDLEDAQTVADEDRAPFKFPELPESRTSGEAVAVEVAKPEPKPPKIPILDEEDAKKASLTREEHVRRQRAPAAAQPSTKERAGDLSGWIWVAVGALVGALVVVFGLRQLGDTETRAPRPVPSEEAPPTTVSESPPAGTTAASTPTPMPSASAAPRATSNDRSDVDGCVRGMFPEGAFGDPSKELSFGYVCEGKDPVAVADQLRTAVVGGRPSPGSITGTMRLWSKMGWFRMAFASAARHRCCSSVVRFETPLGAGDCKLDERLHDLGAAVATRDHDAMRQRIAAYETSVRCLSSAPTSKVYKLDAPGTDGHREAFEVAIEHFRE